MVRARAPASIHGLRCGGVAITAVSFTIAIGLSSWSTTTRARAWAASARRIASASGRFAGMGMARRASVRACRPGSRSRTRVARSAWPAPVHMKAAITASQTASKSWMPLPALAYSASGITSTAIASTRPAQAATTVACPGRPVSFHTPARSILPPSSGRPGSRLKTPTSTFAITSWKSSTRRTPPPWTPRYSAYPPAASASETAGPAAETRNSRPGVGGSRSISENPPSG